MHFRFIHPALVTDGDANARDPAARGLGRKTGRVRSDADQRLIKETDGAMRAITYASEKLLYWGGEKPARAGSSLGQ